MSRGHRTTNGQTLRIKTSKKHWVRPAVIALVILVIAVIGGYFLAQHFHLFDSQDTKMEQIRNDQLNIKTRPVTDNDKDNYKVAPTYPRYLTIDSIGVKKARILALGVLKPDKDGAQQLDAPQNIYDVGWYNCQINPVAKNRCSKPTLPGGGDTKNAALIDGHSCTASMDCVFNKLARLKSGDKIIVERGDGKKLNYTVQKVSVVDLKNVDMNKLMKPIAAGKEGLNLISCTGSWTAEDDQGIPTMNQRVTVYAIKV